MEAGEAGFEAKTRLSLCDYRAQSPKSHHLPIAPCDWQPDLHCPEEFTQIYKSMIFTWSILLATEDWS